LAFLGSEKMRKYLVLTLALILATPLSVVVSAPTPSGSNIHFSLWYTNDLRNSNGTAFPTVLNNCLTIKDIRYASGGVSPSSPGGRVLIVTNDGNVPVNITVLVQNLNMPSNLIFNLFWGNYFGESNKPLVVEAGQSITFWFIADAVAGGSYNSNGQWITNYTWGASFSYSYDIAINAVSPSSLTAQQTIHVAGNNNYPQIGPQPTPIPTLTPTPTANPTSNATPLSSPAPTPTDSSNPSPSTTAQTTPTASSPTQTPTSTPALSSDQSASPSPSSSASTITPEFPLIVITAIILIAVTAVALISKKYVHK
jgi:hypothetical protein